MRRIGSSVVFMIAAILVCQTLGGCSVGNILSKASETITAETSAESSAPTPTPEPTPTPVPTPTPTPEPEHILVSFLGDCTLADALAWSGSEGSFDDVVEENGYEYCFQNCAELLSQDDMTLANFEGTITDSTAHLTKEFVFGGPFEYTEMLTFGSIEAVNLANNHSYDYLDQGLADTQAAMEEAGIAWSNQNSVAIYEVRGIKIGMFGIDYVSGDSTAMAYPLIDELREEGCNIIIASCHWGVERDYTPRDSQVVAGHDLIDYGVDIVVGTHPHRLQPIENYNGRYILYSISNFCFGGNTGLSDPDSAIIQCEFTMNEDNTAVDSYTLNVIPYCQTSTRPGNDYCPVPYEWGTDDYYRVLERLNWSQEDE